jgi:catechol 2,3-dioxygenase-like lactoylglutathione lyase family enzyme
VISGAHVILYSQDAEADRAFLRDVLDFPGVDAGGGWLIFKLPPAEVAVHPTDGPPQHEFFLMCDDLDAQLGEFRAQGVEITRPVSEQRWGKLTAIRLPAAPNSRCTNDCTPSLTACDPMVPREVV